MKPAVSIIIVKYRSEKYLPGCLASIGKSPQWEVIIIDNDQKNIGFGSACNRGAKKAKGKYLFFLNPDTIVRPKSIELLIIFLKKHRDVGIVAPLLLDKNRKPYKFQGTGEMTPRSAIFALSFLNKLWPNNPVSKKYWLADWNKKRAKEVAVVPGSALMIRKDVFEKVGGFDENLFLYFEESDLCKRVRKAGWRVFFEPEAKVVHFWGASTPRNKEIEKIFRRSRFYFFKKHYGLIPTSLVNLILNLKLDLSLLILFLFNFIFFAKPILRGLYFSSADILQRFPSFNLGHFYLVKNSLLFDPVTQFLPWFKLAGEILKTRSFPLWNSFNAGGVPFLANMQSAIFFPISFFYYLFNFREALILASFSKLFLIGLFTYLYLRELDLDKYPSLIGATAFNFAGFNILWIFWPHTNGIIFLPLLFLLCEKIGKKSLRKEFGFVLLSLSFMFLFLAGHPETAFHIILLTLIYCFFRFKERFKFVFSSLIAGIFLSAFQLLPFFEYLLESYAFYRRSTIPKPLLPFKSLIFNFFPNLFGNPSTLFYRPIAEFTNYNETVGSYVGPTVLCLAFLAIVFLFKKDKLVRFFSVLLLCLLPFIYRIPILEKLISPFSFYTANTRLLFAWGFCFSVLSAKFVNVFPLKKKGHRLNLIFIFLTILLFPLFIFLLENYGKNYLSSINPQKAGLFLEYLTGQISLILIIFLFSLFLIKSKKNYSLILLAILIFLQTGFLNKNYNPSIEEKYFYPETEEIKFLKSLPRGRTIELGGNFILPPNVNLWYGLASVQNYDALEIKRYKTLFDYLFNQKTEWGTILRAEKQFLDLLGVRYILANTEIDKKIFLNQPKAEILSGELLPEKGITQEFNSDEEDLKAIIVLTANFNRENNCQFNFTLSELNYSKEIFSRDFDCSQIFDKNFFQIDFPKIKNSKNKKFKISFRSASAALGNAISFWTNKEGELVLLTVYDQKEMENLNLIFNDRIKIYENETPFPNYFLVNQSVKSEKEKIMPLIKENKFDLRKNVILEEEFFPLEAVSSSPSVIETLKDRPNFAELRLNSQTDGYLVTNNSYFPGWRAFVDGKETKFLRANYAFGAVFVPRGSHIVEFIYKPKSFIVGSIISVLAALFIIWKFYDYRHCLD